MQYLDFVDLSYKPKKSDLVCLFRVEPAPGFSMKEVIARVASESSNGTWTDLKVPEHIRALSAKAYWQKGFFVKVAYPEDLFEEGNMPQVLSSIAGNIFGMKAVNNLRLEDVQWPRRLVKSFLGPQFGIPGIRKFMKIKKRPLTATVPKPKVGYYAEEHAQVGYDVWTGGIDLLKDDENLSSQKFNQFEKRVLLCAKMRDRAEKETGERKSYLINITADTNEMVRRAKFAADLGWEYVMVDILTAGWASLQTIREVCSDFKLAIHAHRAFHAAFDRNPKHGMSMKVIAECARLIGVDQVHIGGMGKLAGDKKEVRDVWEKCELKHVKQGKDVLGQDWQVKPVLGVCSGGLHVGILPRLLDLLGSDICIQAGGGVLGHPSGAVAGARALRQAIDAAIGHVPLKDAARKHIELKEALDYWGYKTPV